MQHPINFLSADGTLRPEQIELLEANYSERWDDESSPGKTGYRFDANAVNDVRDRVIVIDREQLSFETERAEGCQCEDIRFALDCQCMKSRCPDCGREFMAMENACNSLYCIYQECEPCNHQRESCQRDAIRSNIRAQIAELRDQEPAECEANIAHAAIARVLGAGSGEAPVFPVTASFLDETCERQGDNAWRCPDDSRLRTHSRTDRLLRYEAPPPTEASDKS